MWWRRLPSRRIGWVRSMDWGSASPFSVGWWVIVQDDYLCDFRRPATRVHGPLPRMVRHAWSS